MPSANNYDLTTAILRDEWGFKGFVMTDWGGGISQPALSVCAGNDMIQPGGPAVVEEIAQALASEDKTENRGVRPYSQKMHIADLQACAMHILGVIPALCQRTADAEAGSAQTGRNRNRS